VPKGSNTINIEYNGTSGILTPGTQWMFADARGDLKEWNVIGYPSSPKTLQSNITGIQFEVPLDESLSIYPVAFITPTS
jgi:hypothetical protein